MLPLLREEQGSGAATTVEQRVIGAGLKTLGKLEPAVLAQHADDIVANLADENSDVREAAVKTLGKLEPAVLALHADAIVAKLADEDGFVRRAALHTLGKLEPAVLSQYRASITQWKERERNRDVLRVAAQVGADTWPRSVPVRPRHPRLLAEGDSDEESDMEAAIMRAAEAGGAPASRGVGATSESGRSSAQGERKRTRPLGAARARTRARWSRAAAGSGGESRRECALAAEEVDGARTGEDRSGTAVAVLEWVTCAVAVLHR